MKQITKKLLVAIAVCLIAATAIGLTVTANDIKNDTPAHIDENGETASKDTDVYTATMYMEDGLYKVDLSSVVGKENLDKITDVHEYVHANYWEYMTQKPECEFDVSSGIASFDIDPIDIEVEIDEKCITIYTELESSINEYTKIDTDSFPDMSFRKYVSDNLDFNGDGLLSTHEKMRVSAISVSDQLIRDLTGIKLFPYLERLIANNNYLITLDVSDLTYLVYLVVENNELESITFGNNVWLSNVYCSYNNLTSLDLTELGWQGSGFGEYSTVVCDHNKLTSLPSGMSGWFWTIDVSHNKIRTLDVTNIEEIHNVDFSFNEIETIVDRGKLYDFLPFASFDAPENELRRKYSDFTADDLNSFDMSGNHVTELTQFSLYTTVGDETWSDEYNGSIYNQTALKTLNTKKAAEGWVVDLSELVSKEGLHYIIAVKSNGKEGAFDYKTGIVTFAEKPEAIDYLFRMEGDYTETEDGKITWDENEWSGYLNVSVEITVDNVLPDKDSDTVITAEYPKDEYEDYIGVSFNAESITEGEEYKAVEKAVGSDYTGFIPYSLTLTDKDGKPFPVKSSITVNIPIPEGWEAGKTLVFYVDGDGHTENMDAASSDDGKYITFNTTHLSVYALVDASSKKTDPEPPVTDPEPPVTDPEPPVTDPEPPVTDPKPPVTDPEPPVTDPEPPVTDPEPPVTDPDTGTSGEIQKPDSGENAEPPKTGDTSASVWLMIIITSFTCTTVSYHFVRKQIIRKQSRTK